MKYEIDKTQDEWLTVEHTFALSIDSGSNKRLIVRAKFDGNGNSIVRFVVLDHGHEETYEKFDAAIYNFNRAE